MLLAHYKIKVKCVGTGYLAVSLTLTGVSPYLQATHPDCMSYSFLDLCWQHSNVLTSRHHYTPRLWIHLDDLCFKSISILPLAAQAKSGQTCLQVTRQSTGTRVFPAFSGIYLTGPWWMDPVKSQSTLRQCFDLSQQTQTYRINKVISNGQVKTQRKISPSVSCLFLASC